MINAASSRLQTNHVIKSKKYLFHRYPPCFENKRSAQQDWKWGKNDWTFTMWTFIPTRGSGIKIFFFYSTTPYSNAPASQSKAATLFSFRAFRFFHVATQSFLASFSLFSCMASFLLTTSIASLTCFWRPQQGSRINIGERGDWPTEQRRSWNCGAPSSSAQRSTGSFTCDWKKENAKKAQCWENMKKGEAVASLARLSMKLGERKLGCLRHRWAKRPRPDALWSPNRWPKTNQWSPIGIIIRN